MHQHEKETGRSGVQMRIHRRYFILSQQVSMIQGEIVNILLKIKNSFLPTKQILIGL